MVVSQCEGTYQGSKSGQALLHLLDDFKLSKRVVVKVFCKDVEEGIKCCRDHDEVRQLAHI